MADGVSLAHGSLLSPSGFDHPWDMNAGVSEPAPRREQCTVGAEPGLDLGDYETPSEKRCPPGAGRSFLRQIIPPLT